MKPLWEQVQELSQIPAGEICQRWPCKNKAIGIQKDHMQWADPVFWGADGGESPTPPLLRWSSRAPDGQHQQLSKLFLASQVIGTIKTSCPVWSCKEHLVNEG